MSVYDMIDKFATELRCCLDSCDMPDSEREVGEAVHNAIVPYLTYYDGDE